MPPTSLAGTETILLDEDDATVRGLVALALSRAGYEVLEADDGPATSRLAAEYGASIAVARDR